MSPTTDRRLWRRWTAFARRAAQVQAAIAMWLIYYALFVPLGFLRPSAKARFSPKAPGWTPREDRATDLTSARRQF